MTTLEEVEEKISELREEAHDSIDESRKMEGEFAAYTKALNLVHQVDEIKVSIE